MSATPPTKRQRLPKVLLGTSWNNVGLAHIFKKHAEVPLEDGSTTAAASTALTAEEVMSVAPSDPTIPAAQPTPPSGLLVVPASWAATELETFGPELDEQDDGAVPHGHADGEVPAVPAAHADGSVHGAVGDAPADGGLSSEALSMAAAIAVVEAGKVLEQIELVVGSQLTEQNLAPCRIS
jgi:hypothetical protein